MVIADFEIRKSWINLLVGGGGYKGETEVQLLVDDQVVRTAVGPNIQPGGSEALREHSWDVQSLVGKSARIKIIDNRTGGWGHINVDHIRQSDQRSAAERIRLQKELLVDANYLLVPVANHRDKETTVRIDLAADGKVLQNFNVTLPAGDDDYWMSAFTDSDRIALYECPEFFEVPVQGHPEESHWCLMGASNRYFLGTFDDQRSLC